MRVVLPLAIAAALSGCDMVSAAVGAVPACHDPRVLQTLRDDIRERAVSSFAGHTKEPQLTALSSELSMEPHLVFDSPIDVTPAGVAGRACELSAHFDPSPQSDIRFRAETIRFQIFNASDGSGPTARIEPGAVKLIAENIHFIARETIAPFRRGG